MKQNPPCAPASFVDVLRLRALDCGDAVAYSFLSGRSTNENTITYAELHRRARAIGAVLQDFAIAGERALLFYEPGLDYIAAFFGCLYGGLVAVPAYPPRLNRHSHRVQAIAADAQASVVLTTSAILSNSSFMRVANFPNVRWLATDTLAPELSERWNDPKATSQTIAFLQYTSGSTGTPKGVVLTHGNLLHNSELIRNCFEHTANSRVVFWTPPYHDMGLIGGILQPLYVGIPVTLMSPMAFLQHPLRWLETISRTRATTSGGPNFAYELCVQSISATERQGLDLSSWDVAFCGAEMIRTETLQRFATAFEPCGFRWQAFYPCYGLAEATLIVSGGRKAAPPVLHKPHPSTPSGPEPMYLAGANPAKSIHVGCGHTLGEQQIVVVNTESMKRCFDGETGEIWVSGLSVAQGYWGLPDETKLKFEAYLSDTAEGPFLRTGDLGFLKDGELFVTGRLKDLIIIAGRKHHPEDIEMTAQRSDPALQTGSSAAFSVEVDGEERLVLVHEMERRSRDALELARIIAAVRRSIAEEHQIQVHEFVLVKPRSMPRTSSGKVQKHMCRAAYLSGSLAYWRNFEQQHASSSVHCGFAAV